MPHNEAFTSIEVPLDAKEAAVLVGCQYRRLLQLRALGIVRGYQLVPGGRWHFDRMDLLALKEKLKGRIPVQLATTAHAFFYTPVSNSDVSGPRCIAFQDGLWSKQGIEIPALAARL